MSRRTAWTLRARVTTLVTVALVVVQEMSARLGAFTGEGLMSLIR